MQVTQKNEATADHQSPSGGSARGTNKGMRPRSYDYSDKEKQAQAADSKATAEASVCGSDVERSTNNCAGSDGDDKDEQQQLLQRQLPPQDGREGWIVIAAGFVCVFFVSGHMGAFGVYNQYYLTQKFATTSAAAVSWIGTLQAITFQALTMLAGPLCTRKPLQSIVMAGGLCAGASLLLGSLASQVWQLYLTQGFMYGVGLALVLTPAISAASAGWFDKHRGLATGVISAGGGAGAMLQSLVARRLFELVGWAWTMRITGIAIILATLPASLLIRKREPRKKPTALAEDGQERAPKVSMFYLGAFRDRMFLLYCTICFALSLPFFAPHYYLGAYSQVHTGDAEIGATLLTVLNGSSAVGRIVNGFVGDMVGPLNSLIFCSAVMTLSVGLLWMPAYATAPGFMYSCAASYGFVSGGFISIGLVVLVGIVGEDRMIKVMGFVYVIMAVADLIGIPLQGVLVDIGNKTDFTPLLIFCVAAFAVATVAQVWLKVMADKRAGRRFLSIS